MQHAFLPLSDVWEKVTNIVLSSTKEVRNGGNGGNEVEFDQVLKQGLAHGRAKFLAEYCNGAVLLPASFQSFQVSDTSTALLASNNAAGSEDTVKKLEEGQVKNLEKKKSDTSEALRSKSGVDVDSDPRFDQFRAPQVVNVTRLKFYIPSHKADPAARLAMEKTGKAAATCYNTTMDDCQVTVIREWTAIPGCSQRVPGKFVYGKNKRCYFVPDVREGLKDWLALGQLHGTKDKKPFFATFIIPTTKETQRIDGFAHKHNMSLFKYSKVLALYVRKTAERDPYIPGNVPVVFDSDSFYAPVYPMAPIKAVEVAKGPVNVNPKDAMMQAAVDLAALALPPPPKVNAATVIKRKSGMEKVARRRRKPKKGKFSFIADEPDLSGDEDDHYDDDDDDDDEVSDKEDKNGEPDPQEDDLDIDDEEDIPAPVEGEEAEEDDD